MKAKSTSRIEWNEQHLDSVMRYFAEDFDVAPTERIIYTEYFIDTHRRKVVFKLIVERTP